MKLKYISLLALITILLMSVGFQSTSASVGDFKSNKFIFNYTDSVKYVNSLDTSIKFSGKNKLKTTYSFSDQNGSVGNNYWIFGVEKQDVSDYQLYSTIQDGEFSVATSGVGASQTNYVNMTLLNPDSYNTTFSPNKVDIIDYSAGFPVVTTLDSKNINTPFIVPDHPMFVINPDKYIAAIGNYYKDQVTKINNDNNNLKVTYTASGLKFTYDVSGQMLDYHLITHYTKLQSDTDYNSIVVSAKISLEYSKNGVLKTYNEEWSISNLNKVKIIDYTIAVTTGFFANVKYNLPGFGFYVTILTLFALPVILKIKRRRI